MTTICGGGTSGPKPGVDTAVYVDSAYVRSLLPAALSWLYPFLPWMQALEIGDVSTFCSTDPPAVPSVPSTSDIFSLLTGGNLGNAIAVNEFLQNIAKQYLWRSLCQCTTGSATAYSPPANPGNLPSVNNPTVVNALSLPCFDFTSSTATYSAGNSLQRTILDVTGNGGGVTGPTQRAYWVQWDTTITQVVAPGPTLTVAYHVGGTTVSSQAATGGHTLTALAPVPTTATTVDYTVNANAFAGQTSEFTRTRLWCTATSPTLQDCCDTGPNQGNILLRQILDMVTLIQRNRVPYAYIDGSTHSGLSGTGTLTIPSGLIGLRTTVTTNPPYTGQAGSNPTAIFDVGYVSVGDSTGWNLTQPIRQSPWIWFPEDMSTWTRVGYNLNPGVVVSITELEAEA